MNDETASPLRIFPGGDFPPPAPYSSIRLSPDSL